MHKNPNTKIIMGGNIIENLPALDTIITIRIDFPKNNFFFFKVDQEHSHLVGDKFVNGDTYGLLFLCSWSFTF